MSVAISDSRHHHYFNDTNMNATIVPQTTPMTNMLNRVTTQVQNIMKSGTLSPCLTLLFFLGSPDHGSAGPPPLSLHNL